uniref:Uncharacterized protein n=1 Tax=Rangifer tarandus platyrhynchus TaxID=3082113 RepID=A0ACB0F584_RANTA|nr:unnamed protein product [Rangifer tarandus platyrhynchus]
MILKLRSPCSGCSDGLLPSISSRATQHSREFQGRRSTQGPGMAEPRPVEATVGEHSIPRPGFWATGDPRGAGGTRQPPSCHACFPRLDLGSGGFMLDGRVSVCPLHTPAHTQPLPYREAAGGKLVKGRPSPRALEGIRASGRDGQRPDPGHRARGRTHSPLCLRAR